MCNVHVMCTSCVCLVQCRRCCCISTATERLLVLLVRKLWVDVKLVESLKIFFENNIGTLERYKGTHTHGNMHTCMAYMYLCKDTYCGHSGKIMHVEWGLRKLLNLVSLPVLCAFGMFLIDDMYGESFSTIIPCHAICSVWELEPQKAAPKDFLCVTVENVIGFSDVKFQQFSSHVQYVHNNHDSFKLWVGLVSS